MASKPNERRKKAAQVPKKQTKAGKKTDITKKSVPPTQPDTSQPNEKKMVLTMPDGTQYIFDADLEEKKPRKAGMDAIKQMREYVQRKGSRYKFQKVKKN